MILSAAPPPSGVRLVGNQNIRGVKTFRAADDNTSNVVVQGCLDLKSYGSDSPTMVSATVNSSGWTTTGWTGSYGSGWTHTPGNTSILTASTEAIVSGRYYAITFTITGRTAGSVRVGVGGPASLYYDTNGTITAAVLTTSTSGLAFGPTTDFDGTISNVELRYVSAQSKPIFRGIRSDDVVGIDFRVAGGSGNDNNTSVGYNAMTRLYTGSNNTGYGYGALGVLMSGDDNTAVGYSALGKVLAGNRNIAMGIALQNALHCDDNICIGGSTAAALTYGCRNIFLGTATANAVTTGSDNIAIGNSCFTLNQTGSGNVCVGASAMAGSASYSYCTAVGNSALASNTGSYNTAFGYRAGVGQSATTYPNTSGQYNTFIGYEAAFTTSTQRNYSIAIGFRAHVDADNACILGGTGGNAVNVGSGGVTAPAGRLEIKGAGTTTGLTLRLTDSAGNVNLDVRDDGAFAFRGGTVAVADTGWTDSTTNYSALRNLGFDFTGVTATDANFRLLARFGEALMRAAKARGFIS